jgi:hypothetical protein
MSTNMSLPQAASFTDDTSLPYAGCRVSIHAQIIREHKLGWYFFLKDHTPHNNGEFKDQAMDTFFTLAEADREKVFKTLRTVRIHIVDPRPYTVDLNEALQRHLPKGTTMSHFLKRLDASTRHLAHVRQSALEHIATSILRDAPAERLKMEYRAWEYSAGIRVRPIEDSAYMDAVAEPEPDQSRFDLSPFEHKNANMLNDVANFVSASASVFFPALDEFDEAKDDYFFTSPLAGPWLINSTLGHSHAFDEGHSHAVKWIEGQRADVLSRIDRNRHYYPAYLPQPLVELVSTESVPIQAADIAASIAREMWHRNNLPHLVSRFEYVTFNGERLSDTRAQQYEAVFRGLPPSN